MSLATQISSLATRIATEINTLRSQSVFEAYPFAMPGTITTRTGKERIYTEGNYVIQSVRASVGTAPTGASIKVNVLRNETTIYGTIANQPTIAISGFTSYGGTASNGTFVSGDYFTVDVDQVGSTIAGADLTVVVRLKKTS